MLPTTSSKILDSEIIVKLSFVQNQFPDASTFRFHISFGNHKNFPTLDSQYSAVLKKQGTEMIGQKADPENMGAINETTIDRRSMSITNTVLLAKIQKKGGLR